MSRGPTLNELSHAGALKTPVFSVVDSQSRIFQRESYIYHRWYTVILGTAPEVDHIGGDKHLF